MGPISRDSASHYREGGRCPSEEIAQMPEEKDQYAERWGPARRLINGETTPQEYQASERSYQIDYESAMRTLAERKRRQDGGQDQAKLK